MLWRFLKATERSLNVFCEINRWVNLLCLFKAIDPEQTSVSRVCLRASFGGSLGYLYQGTLACAPWAASDAIEHANTCTHTYDD